jgi:TldD protein
VRVGSPKLDNYHRVRGRAELRRAGPRPGTVPFEDNVNSIKRLLWLDTDRAYQSAAERLIRIKTNTQVRVAEADDSDDFSSEPPVVSVAPPPKLKFDEEAWRERVRKLSARFQNYPSVLTSHVSVSPQTETKYFVNTEGTASCKAAASRA